MQAEIEAKFLDLNHDEIRAKLKAAGADLVLAECAMRRTMYDFPDMRLQDQNWSRIRVRDEGKKITLAFKSGGKEGYSKEIETTVGDYAATCQLLEAAGLKAFSTQETKREVWQLDNVEIMLDQWPWLHPFIEIEGPSEESIKAVAAQLGLEWAQAKFGNADTVYRHEYPGMKADETIGSIETLTFAGELPVWLAQRQ